MKSSKEAAHPLRQVSGAELEVGSAERRLGYEHSKLADLLPRQTEIARLEIEEWVANGKLDRAQTALELLHRIQARMSGPTAANPADAVTIGQQEAAARDRKRTAETALARVRADLKRIREEVRSRDKELRAQWGLSDSD
jgi:predicted  nucleic acid-binding Zn-ribbon protein